MNITPAIQKKSNKDYLDFLNTTLMKLHTGYEEAFWKAFMGDKASYEVKNKALTARDMFSASNSILIETQRRAQKAKGTDKVRLEKWIRYFKKNSIPPELHDLRKKIADLEAKISTQMTTRKEGYTDPHTGTFVEKSANAMGDIMWTSPDEAIRKACFEATETLALTTLDDYIELIKLRNLFTQKAGYANFYEYKSDKDEEMTVKELFAIFEPIYEQTKFAFKNIRELEKTKPGLRKPWNFNYMMTGDFTKEEEPYMQFEKALELWGKTFTGMGINFRGGTLKLDFLDRKGKYSNGFCHQPRLVSYKGNKRIPGQSNFTCNLVVGQIGSGDDSIHTLFHEGGHAAHFLNADEKEVCNNHEYPPTSVSLAETQSMFMDSVSSSIEWRMRYLKNEKGESYPFDIFERKVRAFAPITPLRMMSTMAVMHFEREVYECPAAELTREKVIDIAKKIAAKFGDRDGESIWPLRIPHIYSWDSSAYYHGYGLAEIAVTQWREYFYKKYGYIVDNPKIGKEMAAVWKFGGLYSLREIVRKAMKTEFNPDAYIKSVTQTVDQKIAIAKERVARLEKVKPFNKKIDLKAKIILEHGLKKVADNSKGFEVMAEKYAKWLETQKQKV